MRYDLEIGTPEAPTWEQLSAWAAGVELRLEPRDGGLAVAAGDALLFTLDGPVAAEPADFADAVAAAVPAVRWRIALAVPPAAPEIAIPFAGALAKHVAKVNHGAAYDPQADEVTWPVEHAEPERADRVWLSWFVAPGRWSEAPGRLLGQLARRCPEALPQRYGRWEPLPHRLDPDDPGAFVRFVLDPDDGSGFWTAAPPSFGGSWRAPDAGDDPRRVGRLDVDLDGRALGQDPDGREAIVDLFRAVAGDIGAFFAAAQVEPGWIVTPDYRLAASAETLRDSGEHVLARGRWHGLPPVPMWLSWFGAPYAGLVEPHLPSDATVEAGADGLFARLGAAPRPAPALGAWRLPVELTYRRRAPIVHAAGVRSNPPEPGDRAAVIPPLG